MEALHPRPKQGLNEDRQMTERTEEPHMPSKKGLFLRLATESTVSAILEKKNLGTNSQPNHLHEYSIFES